MPNDPDIAERYRAALTVGGVYLREDRGLIEVAGRDRVSWLHNLVTNVVKTLRPGEGNYAFAASAKGRTVFDANILVLEDRIWLEIDKRWIAAVLRHLNHYIITEDVALTDLTPQTVRVAVLGPKAALVVERLGFGDLALMAQLQHVAGRIGDAAVRMLRNDFAGLRAADFIITGDGADAARNRIAETAAELGLAALARETIEILRIESGIPASIDDIDQDVIPPETGQMQRGISYQKGCYLGQEIIERMRSHGVLPRKLVGLRVGGDTVAAPNSTVTHDGQDVGRVTSSCWSEALGAALSLAYVKTAYAAPSASLIVRTAAADRPAGVVPLPVSARPEDSAAPEPDGKPALSKRRHANTQSRGPL